jgi:hypothetical protein
MEDDIKLKPFAKQFIQDNIDAIRAQDVVLLSHCTFHGLRETGPVALEPLDHGNFFGGTFFYSVNKQGAQKILQYIAQNGIHAGIDLVLYLSSPVNVLVANPPLCTTDVASQDNKIDTDVQRDFSSINLGVDHSLVIQSIRDSFLFVPGYDQMQYDMLHFNPSRDLIL